MTQPRPQDGNRLPRWLPALNQRIVNPIQRFWTPYLPPYALIEHRGRKTGTAYRTPVMAFRRGNSLVVFLPYGDQTNWLRNVQAGGATLVRMGRRRSVASVTVEADCRIRRAVLHLADPQ